MALLDSEDERNARSLIQAAGSRGAAPDGFTTLLFDSAAPEDLVRYRPEALASLSRQAWEFMAQRKPGQPKVRVTSPDAPEGDALRAVSVIEVLNDDMPFLVDSVMAELNERGIDIELLAHPILPVERDPLGELLRLAQDAAAAARGRRESYIHIHVGRIEDAETCAELVQAIETVLGEVRLVVQDWKPMLGRVTGVIADLKANPPPVPVDDIAEAIQFLEWLCANNFTFLGVCHYAVADRDGGLTSLPETGLGILRSPDAHVLKRGGQVVTITPQLRAFFEEPRTLIVTKANVKSRVHRRVYLDYIGVKRFDSSGRPAGEFRIVGLFTSTAYTRSTRSIPYLRRKVDAVMRRAGFDPEGHSGKALVNVLEGYPRDELFQIDEDTLYEFALAILQLEQRPRVRVLVRPDKFHRFVSVLVYVPRDRYDSSVRRRIGAHLAETFDGRVSAYYPFYPEGTLARVHFIIGRDGGDLPAFDRTALEASVAAIVRTWADSLYDALSRSLEPQRARALFARYRDAFSDGYREAFSPSDAVADIRIIEGLSAERPLGVEFYRRMFEGEARVGLKIWSHLDQIPLSDRVPVLENMGFRVVDERTYHVATGPGDSDAWLHDMMLMRNDGGDADLGDQSARLKTAFIVTMRGLAENDGYNALVLSAGLMWRDVALVRAISRFLRQIRVPYSQDYMWATLRRHAAIAAKIVELFHVRFDPRIEEARADREKTLLAGIEEALAAVDSLDEDRIVRHFVNAVQSAIRTNYYQLGEDGRPKAEIAIKFDSRLLDGVPLPRPLYEIFVYSPRVEGVHLRYGKVARGGIRWSDRPQDFRTEILGLVKAQQVKNAVIVPVGAKGGFVPKRLPSGGNREAVQAEGVAAYKIFIGTLLDITDNLGPDGLIHPENVVRHDGDDPYLVVAADKGTATFSDIANGISQEHGFWLGDAFASGGSAGYDHKAMGITARGAWESVKRHFRELDVDIAKTPFTAVGVGDMSGDVFGNGMLRERTTRLIAAFDHRDIFIDPDPDPAKSFEERARLFALSRSSWQDYDRSLLSKGGGIFPRSSKEIVLSAEAQEALGFAKSKATPQELMRAILKAPADLLFFGGIGTYVRASAETDEAVGDRANDPIRIVGEDLRVKVVGEGANLGMTQRGRIEAAFSGVKLNTDAIDNSAGVNTSDVEVNIKIALSKPVSEGVLSLPARNALLAEMTDEVAALVLRNNYLQTLALSLAERRGMEDFGFQQRLMQILEQRGELDREVEYLPDDVELADRLKQSQPLTRPEIAVLLAYAKLSLYSELLASTVPDDPYLGRELGRYFPQVLSQRFPEALQAHRLRREIIATQLANSMINRGGPSLVVRIADKTGAAASSIALAFAAARNAYDMPALNDGINALDGRVTGKAQLALYASVQDLLLDRMVWFLRNEDLSQGLAGVVDRHRDGIEALAASLDAALPKETAAARATRFDELRNAGVPDALARRMADLPELTAAPDVVLIAGRAGKPIPAIAATYFAAQSYFRLDRIVAEARSISVSDYFDRLALDRARDAIGDAERRLTAAMVAGGEFGEAAVQGWVAQRKAEVERVRTSVQQIAGSGLTVSKLTVAASLLGDLAKE